MGVAELESATNQQNQPQNPDEIPKCPPICPLNSGCDELSTLVRRWPELSDETKRLILLLVREGGRK